MFNEAKLEYSSCFSYVLLFAWIFITLYEINDIKVLTIKFSVYFPVGIFFYLDSFPCFYVWASCTLIATFRHAYFLSLTVLFRFFWHFCFYENVFKNVLPSKSCKGRLRKDFSHITVLGHSSPVLCLDFCYSWKSWIKLQCKDWYVILCLFFLIILQRAFSHGTCLAFIMAESISCSG